MKKFILLSLFCISLTACSAQEKAEVDFTGDIMMHYAVKGCALVHSGTGENKYTEKGFYHLFEKVSPELLSADFAIGNMEFPVSPPFIQNEFIFNCPPEVIPALKHAGFYAVNLANNHIIDQGLKGASNTFGFLEKAGLLYFGSAGTEKQARQGIILEKNGIRIGILSYAGILNYPFPPVNKFVSINNLELIDKVTEDIREIKKRCDFLVIQPHAGVEYTMEPTDAQRILYKRLCNEGADIIIGHHPHTLQYVESIQTNDKRDCTIFYSLGNFISNQNYIYPIPGSKLNLDIRESAIVRLRVVRKNGKISSSTCVIPILTNHEMLMSGKREYKDIQTLVISREIEQLNKEAETADKKRLGEITKRIAAMNEHRIIIEKVLLKKGSVKNLFFDRFPEEEKKPAVQQ